MSFIDSLRAAHLRRKSDGLLPEPATNFPTPVYEQKSCPSPPEISQPEMVPQAAESISIAEPKSIVQTMRDHCRSLAEIVGDLPNRKQQLHKELRAAGLIGKAKMKKRKKMMV